MPQHDMDNLVRLTLNWAANGLGASPECTLPFLGGPVQRKLRLRHKRMRMAGSQDIPGEPCLQACDEVRSRCVEGAAKSRGIDLMGFNTDQMEA